jgi:hypothetical protein
VVFYILVCQTRTVVTAAFSFPVTAIGGQVLCEASWADAVLDIWAELRSLESPVGAAAPSTNPGSSVALNGGDIWWRLSSNVPSNITAVAVTSLTPSSSHFMPSTSAVTPVGSSLSGVRVPSAQLPSFLKQPLPTYQEEEEGRGMEALEAASTMSARIRGSGRSAFRLSSMQTADNAFQSPNTLGSKQELARSVSFKEVAQQGSNQKSLMMSSFQRSFSVEISEGSLTPAPSKVGVGVPLDSIPSAASNVANQQIADSAAVKVDDSSSIEEATCKRVVLALRRGLLRCVITELALRVSKYYEQVRKRAK